jgi:hypothetical protein
MLAGSCITTGVKAGIGSSAAAAASSDHALEVKHKTASKVETHAAKGVRQKVVGNEIGEVMKFSVMQKKTAARDCRQQSRSWC